MSTAPITSEVQILSNELSTHSWVTDMTSTHPNHPKGYVYCEHCDQPYSEQMSEPPCNHDPAREGSHR